MRIFMLTFRYEYRFLWQLAKGRVEVGCYAEYKQERMLGEM